MLSGPIEHQRTAREDEQDDWLAGGGDGFQKLLLVAGQVEICAGACLTAHGAGFSQGEDNDIGGCGGCDGLGKAGLRCAVDFRSFGVEQRATHLAGTLFDRLAEGNDVWDNGSAAPRTHHLFGVVGERPDESDPFERGREREQRRAAGEFIVLEQDEGFFRSLADQRAVGGEGSGNFDALGVRMLKEARGVLDSQDAAHSIIDHAHGNLAGADKLR